MEQQKPQIAYSCYYSRSRSGEQFVPEHVFSYQISGTLIANDGTREYVSEAGDFRFTKRNQLMRFLKEPPAGGEFASLSVFLDQELLRTISLELGYTAERQTSSPAQIALPPNSLYKHYMESLLPYQQLSTLANGPLMTVKLREAVLLLIGVNPELKNMLFDFTEPGKIDLEAFMNQYFQFNVELSRFAYLTGRSLATFKRDFDRIFHSSPSRWLLQKRLQEAYYQIKNKGKMPSEVYLELGFEDLSHFSFAFKKRFGVPPSKV